MTPLLSSPLRWIPHHISTDISTSMQPLPQDKRSPPHHPSQIPPPSIRETPYDTLTCKPPGRVPNVTRPLSSRATLWHLTICAVACEIEMAIGEICPSARCLIGENMWDGRGAASDAGAVVPVRFPVYGVLCVCSGYPTYRSIEDLCCID